MRKLEITLSEEQYQHIQEEIKYYNRVHLSEGVFGGYEITLHVSIPQVYGSLLEMKMANTIDLGEVEWEFVKVKENAGGKKN
ncbi:MAG: hypothetical protein R6W85_09270 [Gillisia sp.]